MLDGLDEGAVARAGAAAGGRLRLRDGRAARAAARRDARGDAPAGHVATVLAPLPSSAGRRRNGRRSRARSASRRGAFEMGSDEAWAYDNERPRHVVEVPAFFIDRYPVTNREFLAFIEDGGYRRRELWHDAGWSFQTAEQLEHPLFWRRAANGWERRRFGAWEPLPPDEPVCHVCWYEADAYARWAGRTAAHRGRVGEGRCHGARREGPALPLGRRSTLVPSGRISGRSPDSPPRSVRSMAGRARGGSSSCSGTSGSGRRPISCRIRGFARSPTRSIRPSSSVLSYKVLRGGSWAVAPDAIRNTFRNWDYPIRRQIFAGVRCARDA